MPSVNDIRRGLLSWSSLALLWACAGQGTGVGDDSETSLGGSRGVTTGGMGGGSEAPHWDDESLRPEDAIALGEVRGSVRDEDGFPLSDLPVTVCGPVCYRALTDEAGVFSVKIESFVLVSQYSVQAHGTPWGTTYYHPLPLDLTDGDYDAGALTILSLPDDGDFLMTKLDLEGGVSPEQSAASGPITIEIGEGTVVRLTVADSLAGDEGRRFRSREVERELWAEFAPDLDAERLFALGPFEAEFMEDEQGVISVGLTIENLDGWAPGTEVPLLALGTYLDPSWLTPSAFEPIGIAVVSDDGTSLRLAADAAEGAGLRHLTWIAVGTPVSL